MTANFKETQLEHMGPGHPVEIKVDAYGRNWKAHATNLGGDTGSVFSLLPPENTTGNYVLMFFLSFLIAKNQPGAGGQVAMH